MYHFFNLMEIARKSLLERVWRPLRSPEKMKVYQSVRDQQTPPRHHPDHPQPPPRHHQDHHKPPRQTSPSRPAFLQAGEGRGRRRRNSILSRLAEDSAFEPMGLLAADTKPGSGASRDHLRCGSSSSEGGQGDVPQGRGHGDAGPRLLVEHISQLSEPACRFCQYPAPHLDCSKINIYSGGSHLDLAKSTWLRFAKEPNIFVFCLLLKSSNLLAWLSGRSLDLTDFSALLL